MGLSFPFYEMAKSGYTLVSASALFSRISPMTDTSYNPRCPIRPSLATWGY